MRFQDFVNEEAGGQAFYKRIIEEGLPFLQESGGRAYYRGGVTFDMKTGYAVHQPLKNRTPRDTLLHNHDFANELFVKKFGWAARNGVFATPQNKTAYDYKQATNKVGIFLPIGEVKYVWSPSVHDLTFMLYNGIEDGEKEKDRNIITKSMDTYRDDDLKSNKENEVSVLCTSYYIFEQKLGLNILRYFNSHRRY